MLGIIAPKYTAPLGYQLTEVEVPTIQNPSEVLIKVHAASINPIDVKKANGVMKLFIKDKFPYLIGYDCAGTVTEVGAEVTALKPGDQVYARLSEAMRGSWSEFVKSHERYVALKPASLSFEEAASLPLAGMTALQSLRKYKGSLEGKTVFVPGGLSGTGAMACLLAKNVFKAGKVITTVSTAKVPKVPELLGEGVVDQIIDYTKQKPEDVIGGGTVDFFFDAMGQAMTYLPLMVPSTGMIISISTTPSTQTLLGSDLVRESDSSVSWWLGLILDLQDKYRKRKASRVGVAYDYLFLTPNDKDLDSITEWVESGRLKAVVGTTADLRNIDEVRSACETVRSGKGGIGKAVIKVL